MKLTQSKGWHFLLTGKKATRKKSNRAVGITSTGTGRNPNSLKRRSTGEGGNALKGRGGKWVVEEAPEKYEPIEGNGQNRVRRETSSVKGSGATS